MILGNDIHDVIMGGRKSSTPFFLNMPLKFMPPYVDFLLEGSPCNSLQNIVNISLPTDNIGSKSDQQHSTLK